MRLTNLDYYSTLNPKPFNVLKVDLLVFVSWKPQFPNLSRVSGPLSISYLNWWPILEWCVVNSTYKNGCKKDTCLLVIRLCVKFCYLFRFNIPHNWGGGTCVIIWEDKETSLWWWLIHSYQLQKYIEKDGVAMTWIC